MSQACLGLDGNPPPMLFRAKTMQYIHNGKC